MLNDAPQLLKQQAKTRGQRYLNTIESLHHKATLPSLVTHGKMVCNVLFSASRKLEQIWFAAKLNFFSFDERQSQQVKAIYLEYMPKQSMKT